MEQKHIRNLLFPFFFCEPSPCKNLGPFIRCLDTVLMLTIILQTRSSSFICIPDVNELQIKQGQLMKYLHFVYEFILLLFMSLFCYCLWVYCLFRLWIYFVIVRLQLRGVICFTCQQGMFELLYSSWGSKDLSYLFLSYCQITIRKFLVCFQKYSHAL